MGMYEVVLGIDRAARDTGRRLRVRVLGRSALDAATKAEGLVDDGLDDPLSEYSHAMLVKPVAGLVPAAALPMAA